VSAAALDPQRQQALLGDIECAVMDTFKRHGFAHQVAVRVAKAVLDFLSELIAKAQRRANNKTKPVSQPRRHELYSDVEDQAAHLLRNKGIAPEAAAKVASGLADLLRDKWGGVVISWPVAYSIEDAKRVKRGGK
jgi:hypothetical protein